MKTEKFATMLMAVCAASVLAAAALADGQINEKGFNCAGGTNTGDSDGCRSKARDATLYQFGYAVINNSSYVLAHAILKARLNDNSDWVDVRDHKANMADHDGVAFSFAEAWIASELGTDTASLQDKGFEVRGQIRSTYPGDKHTNCPIVQVNYDDSNSEWRYNKKGQNTDYLAESGKAFMWKPAGTASDVACKVASES